MTKRRIDTGRRKSFTELPHQGLQRIKAIRARLRSEIFNAGRNRSDRLRQMTPHRPRRRRRQVAARPLL